MVHKLLERLNPSGIRARRKNAMHLRGVVETTGSGAGAGAGAGSSGLVSRSRPEREAAPRVGAGGAVVREVVGSTRPPWQRRRGRTSGSQDTQAQDPATLRTTAACGHTGP